MNKVSDTDRGADRNDEVLEPGFDGEAHYGARAPEHQHVGSPEDIFVERFDGFSRFLHLLVITSFLALALTGMIIKFSEVEAFQVLAAFLGGYEVTGAVHRLAAVVTFLYFALHLRYLFHKKKHRHLRWKDLLTGDDTLVPQWKDVVEFGQTVRWFVGRGPRPAYGRWTYWEKFDYFAVFWGVAIIGASGLVLWFPELFTRVGLPGWAVNVATIIHSDEALLAAGFIFTVHFFNTHFRPEKFPMDTVIFTGRYTLEEMMHERPREYQELVETGELEERLRPAPPRWLVRGARIFGFAALTTGVVIVALIIYSLIILF